MQSFLHVLDWRANVHPLVTALADDRGAAYTYAELRAEVERKAGGWARAGVRPGDVVAIVAKNSADFLVHAFAVMRAGATPAFINWRLSARELAEVLTLVEPAAIAADAAFTGQADAAWPGAGARVVIGGGPVASGWRDGQALAGNIHTAFSPAAVIDAIEADRIEFFTAGPSLIDMLVEQIRRRGTADLSSLREIAYGTAPITPASLTAAIETFGCRFRQIYGNTESQSMISLLAPEDHQPGHPRLSSAGKVAFGWEVRVVAADGRDLPLGTAGELLIRGECLFSGYWRDPQATAAAFADGGWYRTGDVAKLTADGYLYILDRARDMIISGGENIYPAEVEAVLAAHPAVADVAVVGRPDPTWGEAVHAVIIPAEDVSADEIITWCRDQLAHFKCPKSVEFTTSFPRTTTGKVLKRELRAQLARQHSEEVH